MHKHNLPVAPGAIIGYRKDGRAIRLIAGGSGDGDGDAGTGDGQGATDDGGGQEGQEGTGGGGEDAGSTGDTGRGGRQGGTPARGQGAAGAQDDAHTAKTVSAIRDEFKAERAKRQAAEKAFTEFRAESERKEAERAAAETERNRKLAVALGVASEDEPPDPAKLAAELEAATARHQAEIEQRETEIRARDVRLAVLTRAPALEANGAALMDSMSFLRSLGGLDPSAEDFTARLDEAIQAATEANPQYKSGTAVRFQGTGDGGAREKPRDGKSQLTRAEMQRMKPAEIAKAKAEGRLDDLLAGKT